MPEVIKKLKSDEGFTLAELLIVIAITGLLTTFVMVNFQSGNRSNDLKSAGTELLQNLRLAQSYTIGGHALKLCQNVSDQGKYCGGNLLLCNNDLSQCQDAVPQGGYGLSFAGSGGYDMFADSDASHIYDNVDYSVRTVALVQKGISVSQYATNSNAGQSIGTDPISITFGPPDGTISLYVGGTALDASIISLSFLVQSTYVPNTCRKVTINRVSGQLSESTSPCNL